MALELDAFDARQRAMAEYRREYSRRRTLTIVFRVYITVGLACVTVILGHLVIRFLDVYMIIAMTFGLALAVASSIALRWITHKEVKKSSSAREVALVVFLQRWKEYEEISTKVLIDAGIKEEEIDTSPAELLYGIDHANVLPSCDLEALYNVTMARNAVIHGDREKLSEEVTPELLDAFGAIIQQLNAVYGDSTR